MEQSSHYAKADSDASLVANAISLCGLFYNSFDYYMVNFSVTLSS